MTIETIRHFFAWCSVINFAVLILWCLLTFLAPVWRGWVVKLFRLDADRFDQMNFNGIMFYKLGIILFSLVPYLALRIIS